MARVIGYVKSFEHGTFFVKDAKGHTHQLKAGEAIHEGELVYGAKSNPNNAQIVIDVTLQGAGDLVIAGSGALHFDASLLKGIFIHDDAVVYVNSVKDALALNGHTAHHAQTDNNNPDVTHGGEQGNDDETAAGNAVTDTEHIGDTFDLRDGLTQDVSTIVSDTGTGTTSSISSIQSTVVEFVPTITVMVPLSTNDKTPTIIGTSNLIGAIVTLIVTDSEGNEQILHTIVQTNSTYSIDVPNDLAVGDYTVKASVRDSGGNSVSDSDQGTINPFAPSISLDNLADVSNDNTPTISGTSDQIGGTVTLIVTSPGGGLQVLHAVVQNDGTFSTEVPSALLDGTFTVEARVYSSDGILGEDIENAQIDTYVDVQVWAPDNSNDNLPTIYGTSDEVGATVFLKVTDANGKVQELTAVVNSNHIYNVKVTEVLPDGAYTVEARVKDAVGNEASNIDNGSVDTVPPTLTVDVPENTTDNTPTITGTSDEIGGTVTLVITDSAGNEQTIYTEVQADGSYSVDVPESLEDGSFTVDASVTDPANNETTANDTGNVNTADLVANAPTISFESTGTDSLYNAAEVGADGTITATITLPGDAAAGDTLTINGVDQTLSAQNITDGKVTLEVAPGASVSASITDTAGNTSSPANETAPSADLVANAPTISFESTGTDSLYNAAEVGADGTITATITLPGDAAAGDTLTINGVDQTLSAQNITDGKVTLEVAPGASVSASITDTAGNTSSPANETAPSADLVANAPIVTITEDVNNDGVISGSEISGTVGVTVTLPDDAAAGDTLNVTGQSPIILSQDQINTGSLIFEYARPADGVSLTVSATITDTAGNTSLPGIDSATMGDTTATTPNLSPLSDINVLNEGSTLISTGLRDVVVNQYDMGAGVSQANLEAELGLPVGSLDNRFDPTGPNVNDPGFVDIIDGKTTEANYDMTSGMTVTWDYTFKNGEDLQSEVANGFNDQVILVVTDPNGVKSYIMVDSSESKFPNATISDSYSYTATMDGKYTFDWLVLNSGDAWKDSSLALSNANFLVDGVAYSAPIALTALASAASLNDTDGSETLSVTISGIPSGAILSNGTDNNDGSWTLTPDQLANLYILPPDNYTGTLDLTVTATATEISSGDTASVSENFSITVSETTSTVTTGSEASQTLNGTDQNDLIRGYAGDDTITSGNGNDMIFGGAGNDTLDGQAGSDSLYGGVGNDTLVFDAADSVIDGGTGTDSLILLTGTNIDFSALDSSKISNIETIDLSQNGDHTLTNLSYADVINMTDSNHTLTILGDSANDKVQLTQTDNWVHTTLSESGHDFDVYTSNGTSASDPTVTVKVETVITDTVL